MLSRTSIVEPTTFPLPLLSAMRIGHGLRSAHSNIQLISKFRSRDIRYRMGSGMRLNIAYETQIMSKIDWTSCERGCTIIPRL